MQNYVIKNERMRDYLYYLGFNYQQVKDRTEKQDYVYLFPKNELLIESITFYTKVKEELMRQN